MSGAYIERSDNELLHSIDSRLAMIEEAMSNLVVTLDTFLNDWLSANTVPESASAVLSVQTKGVPTMSISVDDTSGNAVLGFEDDKGDVTSAPPGDGSGLSVTFSSDNPTVATVSPSGNLGADANGNSNYESSITPLSEGTFNLSALVANNSGAALTDADGTSPFVQPSPLAVTVTAGQAASGSLAVNP